MNTDQRLTPVISAALMLATLVRKLGLREIKRRIEEERCGAYARWVQSPPLLAMMVPTGLLRILSVLF